MLDRFDEDLADQRDDHRHHSEHHDGGPDWPELRPLVGVRGVAGADEEFAVRAQREDEAEHVGDQQQHRQPDTEIENDRIGAGTFGRADERGHDQRDRRQEQHARLQARRVRVVLL